MAEQKIFGTATLFIRNIPFDSSQKDLETFVNEKCGKSAVTCILVANQKTESEKESHKGFAFLHFETQDTAKSGLKALNNASYKGRKLRVEFALKKTADLEERKAAISRKKQVFRIFVVNGKQVEKKVKLCLLNTPFKIKQVNQELLAVEFHTKSEAETAIEKLQKGSIKAHLQTERYRLIMRNLPFGIKEEDLKEFCASYFPIDIHLPAANKGFAFLEFESKEKSDLVIKELNGKKFQKRTIAIDHCLSKNAFQEAQVSQEEEHAEVDSESEVEPDDDTESKVESQKVESVESQKLVVKPDDVDEGATIFIRGLPDETDKKDIYNVLAPFGKVVFCKLVTDKKSGEFKHSCFVKLESKQVAERIVEECKKAFITDNTKSVLVNEGEGVHLYGKPLNAFIALSQNQLTDLQEKRENGFEREDKRNLYLLKEGLILDEGSVPKENLEKRLASYQQRKEKLKNPNFYISKTRLSIRNLPLQVDEKRLKSLCIGKTTQVKIVRSKDRLDQNGKFRSMGYGFVEFANHEDALKSLHKLNNNPNILEEKKRLIVEFAIENNTIIKKREERSKSERSQEKQENERDKEKKKKIVKNERNPRNQENQGKNFERNRGKNFERSQGKQEPKKEGKVNAILKKDTLKASKSAKKRKNEETDDFDKLLLAYKKKLQKTDSKTWNL